LIIGNRPVVHSFIFMAEAAHIISLGIVGLELNRFIAVGNRQIVFIAEIIIDTRAVDKIAFGVRI